GWPAEEVLGSDIVEVITPRHSADEYRHILQQLAGGEAWSGESLVKHRDGTLFWTHVGVTPVRDDHGEITTIISVSTDATLRRQQEAALRESEARFRSAFDDAAIGMALVALDLSLVRVNPALCRMLGYEAEE